MLGLHLKYHSLLYNALKFVQNIFKLHSYIILSTFLKVKMMIIGIIRDLQYHV